MGLFKIKLDIEYHRLRLVFDPEEKKYLPYLGPDFVPDNFLNGRSKRWLKKKNKELLNNPILLNEELENHRLRERRKKLTETSNLHITFDSFETMGPDNGTMSKEMELFLNNLLNEENVVIGIHRLKPTSEEFVEDILTNGLIITGNLLMNGANSSKHIDKNISFYVDNKKIRKELQYANVYLDSVGSILVRIPDNELNESILYTDNNGNLRLKPEYIVGYVPVYPNHHIENILKASDLKKTAENYEPNETYEENIYYELTEEKPSRGGR